MNCRLPVLIILCSALAVAGCSPRKPASAISGIVGYATPLELSGKAKLQLMLTDVSAEGNAPEIAHAETDINKLPIPYSLPYDADKVNTAHRYTVSARIYVDGTLKYATDTAIEVLTQGKSDHADFNVIATGGDTTIPASNSHAATEIFSSEIRNNTDIALYRAGITDGHVTWLEEDRSNGTPTPTHTRYDLKGALLIYYADTSPIEIVFDQAGKPKSVTRAGKSLIVAEHMDVINAARNRAALLRSDALAKRESQMHRKATKNDVN